MLVLALSWREGGICVAGKDINTKDWIRPVTTRGPVQESYTSGLKLLDVTEIELGHAVPVHHQSENYQMIEKPMIKKNEILKSNLQPYFDTPTSIWDTSSSKGRDSLTPEEINKSGVNSSLYLIGLDEMRVSIEEKEYEGKKRKKHYGIFDYNGVNYKLSITDPSFNSMHSSLGLITVSNPFICLSLGEVFKMNGRCYKLIAGVMI